MATSKIRKDVPIKEGDLDFEPEGDSKTFEVFIQVDQGKRHEHAGHVDAPTPDLALQYAREHYGQDQPCVSIWIVEREQITRTNPDTDLIWRTTDQSYRLARGYGREVRKKWEAVRATEDVDEYQKDDLKEAF